jgi:hypothetical protein
MAYDLGSMDTAADATPTRVGRYDIVLPLAVGRTATVYLARPCDGRMDPSLGVNASEDPYFALKLIARAFGRDPTTKRILAAVRSRRHLRHPNVVQVIDIGDSETGSFVLMEYVPGDTLSGLQKLARQRQPGSELPRGVALRILADGLIGLHAVHELADEDGRPLRLLHRAFSAQKILVGTDGLARLADFATSSSESVVASDPVAPELAAADAVDRRADVWAAAAVAWEIVTGRAVDPAAGSTSAKAFAPDVTGELDALLVRALHGDREQRPATAVAFARELESAARGAGIFAESLEVANEVVRLVGPELVERRELLAEARRQQKRPTSAPDVRTMIGMAGPMPLKRAPLPSLPDLPPPPNDPKSELRIEVNLACPVERAPLDILGPPSAPIMEEPEVFRSPVAIVDDGETVPQPEVMNVSNVSPEAAAAPSFARISDVPGVPKSSGVGDLLRPWFSPPWTTKKISILAGVGGGLIGFILVLIAVSGRPSPDARARAAALSASMSVAGKAAPPPSQPSPASTPATIVATSPEPATSAVLQIKANGPIASVTVDGRLVDAVAPSPTLNVDLEDAEHGRPLKVKATGTDGRVASATAESGAKELRMTFAEKPRTRTTAPATTTKHPWSKRHGDKR